MGSGGSGEVELFAWARRRGPWRLAVVSEVSEDLAHDDWVGELRDEAAGAVARSGTTRSRQAEAGARNGAKAYPQTRVKTHTLFVADWDR